MTTLRSRVDNVHMWVHMWGRVQFVFNSCNTCAQRSFEALWGLVGLMVEPTDVSELLQGV